MAEAVALGVLVFVAFTLFLWWVWRDDPAPGPRPKRADPQVAGRGERVLFLCTHNSARSQMAEALLRDMAGDRFDVASAGTAPTSIHPLTIAVMAERGLTLDSHRAKSLSEMGTRWDYVITLCDEAFEECPDFSAKTARLHWRIDDPSRPMETVEQQVDAFCRVRDELALRLRRWLAERVERP